MYRAAVKQNFPAPLSMSNTFVSGETAKKWQIFLQFPAESNVLLPLPG